MKKTIKQKRIAIIGGSFDPFHQGHKSLLSLVKKKFKINEIILVPAYKVPLKTDYKKSSTKHRVAMLKKLFDKDKNIIIDEQEIKRKGISYSYDTIINLKKKYNDSELFLVIGLDQFFIFHQWYKFASLLKKVNLIVVSRTGYAFPKRISECSQELQPLLKRKYLNTISLKNSTKKITFLKMKNIDVSSSLIKERILKKKSIKSLVPVAVYDYIKNHNLYASSLPSYDLKGVLSFCVEELENKKAFDVQTFDLESSPLPFSAGLVASGLNTRQVQFLAKHLKKKIKSRFQMPLLSEEGVEESRWIVLDYGDLVIHIFYDYVREDYNLEELWTKTASIMRS